MTIEGANVAAVCELMPYSGGLIETEKEAKEVFESEGFAISTGKIKLWN